MVGMILLLLLLLLAGSFGFWCCYYAVMVLGYYALNCCFSHFLTLFPRPWTFSWPGGMTSRVSCRRRGRNPAGVWMGVVLTSHLPSIFKRSRSRRSFFFFFHMLGPFRMAHVRWVLMCFAALCNVAGVASQQRMCRRSTWCPPSCQCDLHVNEKWMRWQARRGEEM